MDLSSAFRLLPVRPADFSLLGICVGDQFFIDKCMPFGCSIACATFEKFSSLLHWIVATQSHNSNIIHYLDDFLFVGKPLSDHCYNLSLVFRQTCRAIGVPINDKKTEGPTTKLTFLGLGIDTISQTIFIPEQKYIELKQALVYLSSSKKVTLTQMQSLCGSLKFFAKAVPGSRAFNRRFYNSTIGIRKPHFRLRVTIGMKQDARVWLDFLENFNGRAPFPDLLWSSNTALNLFTDSCASCGGGAFYNNSWLVIKWSSTWDSQVLRDITFLELVPILCAFWVWAGSFESKKVLLHTDNLALVHILNSQSSKSERVMQLVRPLVLLCLRHNIQIKAVHIPGCRNLIADAISRFQWDRFKSLAPQAEKYPSRIPPAIWQVLSIE
ncbi:uncharacterized protein LOC130046337 isoform X1 [Ostrea edulis]|uniref:uncharacterized protein LOC130046337 isoform X1 n=1 Tax=Ostrea edulis TaxID=37623 RepID=UPI0024AEAA54|nr:uncharacterized protein LOC130046337 isoform X1 [Ostrea edulis]